jgi:hypothetical protein
MLGKIVVWFSTFTSQFQSNRTREEPKEMLGDGDKKRGGHWIAV